MQFEERGFNVSLTTETDIIMPTAYAAEEEIDAFIEETPAVGLAGVIAKLRYQLTHGHLDIVAVDLEQMVEVIERHVGDALTGGTLPEAIRAFRLIEDLKPGQTLFRMEDSYHDPHLREGELAVVDLNDRKFQHGELYLVEWPNTGGKRGIYQLTARLH